MRDRSAAFFLAFHSGGLAMRRRKWLAAAFLLLLLPMSQASAQEAEEVAHSEAASVAAPVVQPEQAERVCSYEDVTGSRMRKRVCRTAEQWEARERAAKGLARELDAKPVAERINGG